MIQCFKEMEVFWLGEPFAPEELDSSIVLQPARGSIPLAAAENELGFRERMDSRAVQVAQPDCCRCGGFTEAWRIARRVGEISLRLAPHTWSDAVALVANIRLVAPESHSLTVEIDRTGNPFIDELLTEPFETRDREVRLPGEPGLGIELDEDVVGRYEIPRCAPIPLGNYSDLVFQ